MTAREKRLGMCGDRRSKEHFDSEYEEPDPWHFFTSPYEQTKYQRQIELVKELGVKPAKVLEIGCAEGAHTKMLAEAFPDSVVVAIDVSSRAIERARQNLAPYANVSLHGLDVMDFVGTTPDEEFDLIIWSEVIYYLADRLTPRDLLQFLERLAAKLRNDGVLCMANIINQPDADETPITRKPLMDCYYSLICCLLEPVHRLSYFDHKPESGRTYLYEVWTFRRAFQDDERGK